MGDGLSVLADATVMGPILIAAECRVDQPAQLLATPGADNRPGRFPCRQKQIGPEINTPEPDSMSQVTFQK